MDIKEFAHLDRGSGRLMVWRVNVPDPVSWRPDSRRPSHVQEEHLRSAGDGRPRWLGAAFELPGEFNAAALTRADPWMGQPARGITQPLGQEWIGNSSRHD